MYSSLNYFLLTIIFLLSSFYVLTGAHVLRGLYLNTEDFTILYVLSILRWWWWWTSKFTFTGRTSNHAM